MPEIRKILRIKKQSYKFELRKKYFNRKKFRLREKRPLDAIVAELNKFFPKKVRESEGGRKNPLIAFAMLLVIIGALVILFPPETTIEVKKELVFTAPLLNLTMKDEGVASLGGHASDLRSAYYKLETTAANADSLSVKTSIYDRRVPNQIFILSTKAYQAASYFQFKYALKKRLEARGMLLTEISRAQVETLPAGVLAGYPVVDVKVTLFDGSYHEVDSNENAFRMAASMAFKDGMRKASPVLLEPIMAVEVETAEEKMGDVMGDLSSRRGVIQGMADMPGGKAIRAEVPLAEMFGYSTTLRSLTQGRATYTMEFKHYSEAPKTVAEAIINKK